METRFAHEALAFSAQQQRVADLFASSEKPVPVVAAT